MRKLRLCAFASLLSLTASPHAGADSIDAQKAEQQYEELIARPDAPASVATDQLLNLATVYQENGERAKATTAFQKVLDSKKQSSASPTQVALLMQFWAGILVQPRRVISFPTGTTEEQRSKSMKEEVAFHQEDCRKADSLMLEALKLSSQAPETDPDKYTSAISAIGHYRSRGRFAEADRLEARTLAGLCAQKAVTTNPDDVIKLAGKFQVIASYHLTYGGHQTGDGELHQDSVLDPRTPIKPVEAKPRNSWNRPVASADFALAETLKKDSLQLYDILPAGDYRRARAHRELISWYQQWGMPDEVKIQTEILARLLGSNDPKILFPAKPFCPGCGRG